jgi:hypothetical protein
MIAERAKQKESTKPRVRDTRLPPSRCPSCEKLLDAATSLEGAKPRPGDWSVCIHCTSLIIFTRSVYGLVLRSPAKGEFEALEPAFQDTLRRYQRAARATDRRSAREKMRTV